MSSEMLWKANVLQIDTINDVLDDKAEQSTMQVLDLVTGVSLYL